MNSRLLRSLSCLLLALTLSTKARSSVTITLSSSDDRTFRASDGGILPDGSVVRIGTFDISTLEKRSIVEYSTDFDAVDALFSPLGESRPGSGILMQKDAPDQTPRINALFGAGTVFGQIGDVSTSRLLPGARLYIWVFNARDVKDATEWGIFSAGDGWTSPRDFGSQTLATSEIDLALRGIIDQQNFILASNETGYRAWAASAFEDTGVNPLERDPARDPDGDGLTNLFEYAAGLQPSARDPGGFSALRPIVSSPSNSRLSFEVALAVVRSDLDYVIETSEDLKNWRIAGAPSFPRVPGVQAPWLEAGKTAVEFEASAQRSFARLRISLK